MKILKTILFELFYLIIALLNYSMICFAWYHENNNFDFITILIFCIINYILFYSYDIFDYFKRKEV